MTDRCKQFLQDIALFVTAALLIVFGAALLSGCGTTPRYLQGVCTLNDSALGLCQ